MKRPASVLTTLILFALFILIGVLSVVKNSPSDMGAILVGLIMPTLFLIGWVSVFFKKSWGRIYSSVLIMLVALLMLALPFINKTQPSQQNEQLILMGVVAIAFAWWSYSLLMGQASKDFFQSGKDA